MGGQLQSAMKAAPQGAVTLVFTNVQDSTKLWDTCEGMAEALNIHNDIMRKTIARHKVCDFVCLALLAFASLHLSDWSRNSSGVLLFLMIVVSLYVE